MARKVRDTTIAVTTVTQADRDSYVEHTAYISQWLKNPRYDRRIRIDGTITGQFTIDAREGVAIIFEHLGLDLQGSLIRLAKTLKERSRIYGK